MRLFIAINFNDETHAQLIAMRDELRSRSKRGNLTLDDNLHLTLVFIGECDTKQTAVVKAAMDAIRFEPFNITIDRIGHFKRDRGDLWWAGIQVSKPLIDMQSALTKRLIDTGFPLEKREYSPHITLGRDVVTDAEPRKLVPFGETVASIELMKSERISGKLIYTVIYRRTP